MEQAEIKQITDYVFISAPVEKADVALIFGTKFDEPVYEAVKLYKDGFVKHILFSGGINKHTQENEAERMEKNSFEIRRTTRSDNL